jgi:hypothetical protein
MNGQPENATPLSCARHARCSSPSLCYLPTTNFVETTRPETDAVGKTYVYPYSLVRQSVAVPNHARSTVNPLRSYPARDFAATPGSTIMPSISVSAATTYAEAAFSFSAEINT